MTTGSTAASTAGFHAHHSIANFFCRGGCTLSCPGIHASRVASGTLLFLFGDQGIAALLADSLHRLRWAGHRANFEDLKMAGISAGDLAD